MSAIGPILIDLLYGIDLMSVASGRKNHPTIVDQKMKTMKNCPKKKLQ